MKQKKRVDLARELADKAEEEAVRAANAEKEAKESLRLAQNARKEAEKKALEAVKESERIDEEMKLRLSQLKKINWNIWGQDRHIILTLEIKKMDNMRTSNIIKEGESILVNMKDKVFTIYAYVLWSK